MSNFQIGAQAYSIRDRLTSYENTLETLKSMKAIGYNNIELAGLGGDITPEQFREILDITGINCVCTHYGFFDMEDKFERTLEIHKLWGCSYAGIGGFGPMHEIPQYLDFVRRANAVADNFGKHGMRFVYHNHSNELHRFPELGKTGLELMLENASPNLMFELDLYWVQNAGGDPIDFLHRFAGHIEIVHFKEMNVIKGTNTSVISPVGSGNMNWKGIMKACDELGVKYAFVEQDNAVESDSLECMRMSHDYLVKLGGTF